MVTEEKRREEGVKIRGIRLNDSQDSEIYGNGKPRNFLHVSSGSLVV